MSRYGFVCQDKGIMSEWKFECPGVSLDVRVEI